MLVSVPELIEVKGGRFLMGSEQGAEDERPVHEIHLEPYLIGKYPVTIREFDAFLRESGYASLHTGKEDTRFNHPMQPATSVNWFDAVAYCEWLSRVTGQSYRLPTEAEWEFAATCGSHENIYPWGKRTWEEWPELHLRFGDGPEPVGSFPPNALGISDMGMNVHEWCSDWYSPEYYSASPKENPKGPEQGTRKASRGGSWRHQVKITRCAARSSIPPTNRYADYGFRLAL